MKLFASAIFAVAVASPLANAAEFEGLGGETCATAGLITPTNGYKDSTVGVPSSEPFLATFVKGLNGGPADTDSERYCCVAADGLAPAGSTLDVDGDSEDGFVFDTGVCSSAGTGHWYQIFSGCGDQTITISLESCSGTANNYDIFISVYKGSGDTCEEGLECVVASDDYINCPDNNAAIFGLHLERETMYYVFVHGYSSNVGDYILSVSGALGGACDGDPHFKRWNGEYYDFHGEGDFVFLKNPDFRDGLGMDVQIRTTRRYQYSYIESAALRIGTDILEVSSYGGYMLNGISNADLSEVLIGGQFKVTHEIVNEKKSVFKVHTGKDNYVELKSFKDLVGVNFHRASEDDFASSTGMMGFFSDYKNELLGRDGAVFTVEEANAFGQEWQVQPDIDGVLFQTARSPQFPEPVIMPNPNAAEERRLGESIPKSDAETACAHIEDKARFEHCVYDVIASGDLELAQGGVY